ncbi:MAG: hypothetical protein MSJ26_02830 [Oscillospiraceae bacterium]|nr:hypothetical protein [Oscillospiraceae bacterium]
MTNLNNRLLSIKAADCINSCSAKEYSELLKDFCSNLSGFFGANIGFDSISFISISNIMTAYAARFPQEFLDEYFSYDTNNILLTTVQNAITKNDPAALTLLEKAIKDGLHKIGMYPANDFKDIITAAAVMRRVDCLEYCKEMISDISSFIQPELLCYLFDNGMTDIMDILMEDFSADQIAGVFINKNNTMEFSFANLRRPFVEYIYDTCIRYIPEIRSAENVPAAVSEFMNNIEVSNDSFSLLKRRLFTHVTLSDNAKAELSAMSRLGLYFIDITDIIMQLNMNPLSYSAASREIIIDYFTPVLGERLTFRPFHVISSFSNINIRNELFDRLELIGKDRFSFDIRSNALNADMFLINNFIVQSKKHIPQFFRRLLSSGIKFITDEDLSRGCAADIITQIPLLLSTMLEQHCFNNLQLSELIGKASSEKRTEALNILNKYIIRNGK